MHHTATPYRPIIKNSPAKKSSTSLAIFRALSDHNPEGILVVDTCTQKVVEANVVMGKLFKLDPGQLVNRPTEEICCVLAASLDHPEAFAERFYHHLKIPESSGCFEIRLATASAPAIGVYVTPIRNQEGEVVAKLWAFHDVSAQRALEHGFRESQQLETNARQAIGVVHDCSNLLSVVIGQLEMAADESMVGTEQEDFIEPAVNAALKCSTLLKTVLNHSRRQEDLFEVLNLETELKEVEVLMRAMVPKNISICTQYDARLLLVRAIPSQLHQVMMNLVFNAIDAMPAGGTLSLSLTRQGDHVCLMVKDSGKGMPAHTRKKIFDAFFTTKKKGKGLGMGLHMVAGIVEAHNGTIHCESEPGVGTTFHIALPVLTGGRA